MAEPTSSTSATLAILSAVSITSIFNIDVGILLGALCGAMLLVISQKAVPLLQRILFFCLSFFLGIFLNNFFSHLLIFFLPESLIPHAPEGFGALIASAVSVKLLLGLIERASNPRDLWQIFRRKK